MITSCTATTNTGNGFYHPPGSNGVGSVVGLSVSDSVATNNQLAGFDIFTATTLTGCIAVENSTAGITGNNSNILINCTVTANLGNGIFLQFFNRVTGCRASSNNAYGIYVIGESTVADCLVSGNLQHGIVAAAGNEIRGNKISYTGTGGDAFVSASIFLPGSQNVVDGNICTSVVSGDAGIKIADGSVSNFITRNRVNADIRYIIPTGNHVAPIVVAATSPVVSGSTGGIPLGSTDPLANWSF